MPFTEPLRAAILNKTLVAIDFTTPTAWEVALFSGDDGLEAGNPTEEITEAGYTRLPVTWTPPSNDQSENIEQLEWLPLEVWSAVRFVGVYETDTGTLQYYGALNQAVLPVPPLVLRIAPGNLIVIIDFAEPAGVETFIELIDTPASYAGAAGQAVIVDQAEAGLIFQPGLIPAAHAETHELGGNDELLLDYTQLANVPLAFIPTPHKDTHELGGTDELAIDYSQLLNVPSTFPPSLHGDTHHEAGNDEVDHDKLLGFVLDEHVAHSSISIIAGIGLDGGGTIDANVTLDVGEQPFVDFALAAPPAYLEGRMFYDSQTNLLSYYNDEAEIDIGIGREVIIQVRNATGATILNGSAVYVDGAIGLLPTVDLALADALATSAVLGLATHDIENNTNGYITVSGVVNDLNMSAFTEGDTLFLSNTVPGGLQDTPGTPVAVKIGFVTSNNPVTGAIQMQLGGNQGAVLSPDLSVQKALALTQAEYDLLAPPDPATMYLVTDSGTLLFQELANAPPTLVGHSLEILRVGAGELGLEFVTPEDVSVGGGVVAEIQAIRDALVALKLIVEVA